MITLTATLQAITGGLAEQGSIAVKLCGFGSQVPSLPGLAFLADISPDEIEADVNGLVTFGVYGNDKIAPAGTYYTVAVLNSNGDTVQINAYQIVGGDRQIDLSTVPPFDPTSLAVPALPLPLASRIVPVLWSAAPVFQGAAGLAFELGQLQADTVLSFAGGVPGNLYVFITTQGSDAAHALTYAPMIHGGSAANPQLNGRLVQAFVCRSDGSLDSIGIGDYL